MFQFTHNISVWKLYIFPIVFFSFCYNLPKFLELSVKETCCLTNKDGSINTTTCLENEHIRHTNISAVVHGPIIEPTHLRLDSSYVKYYLIYCNFLVHGLIPFLTLITLNCLIYRQVSLTFDSNN